MNPPRFRYPLVALILCAMPAAAFGQPDPKQSARAHFDRGLSLATRGAYPEAIVEFNQAYQLSPHFAVLFNLGQAYAAAGQPVLATDTLQRYLTEGGKDVPGALRKRAQEDIAAQERLVALVTIRAAIAGATVSVDGIEVGKTPLPGPIRVGRGPHVFAGSIAGYRPWEGKADLRAEERRVVEMTFEGLSAAPKLPASPQTDAPATVAVAKAAAVVPNLAPSATAPLVAPSAEAPMETRPRAPGRASLVVGGLGVVAAGVSVALAIWNKGRYDNWSANDRSLSENQQLPDHARRQGENDDLARSIRKTSVATVSTAIAGAALLATGLVLWRVTF